MTRDLDIRRRLIEHGLDRRQLQVDGWRIAELLQAFAAWPQPPIEATLGAADRTLAVARPLVSFLGQRLQEDLQALDHLRGLFAAHARRRGLAQSEADRRAGVLEFARALGSRGRRLRQDRRALRRWFDHDAVADRCRRRIGEIEQRLAFALGRIGAIAAAAFAAAPMEPGEARRQWARFDLETHLRRFLSYDGDARVAGAAFAALAVALGALPSSLRETAIAAETLRLIYRAALDHRRDVWIQCQALTAVLGLSLAAFASAAERRLAVPRGGDDLFVRRRIVQLAGSVVGRAAGLVRLLAAARADPSPFVRQALAGILPLLPRASAAPLLAQLARTDGSRQVRAMALLSLAETLGEPARRADAVAVLADVCAGEGDGFVLRTACKVIVDGFDRLARLDAAAAAAWYARLAPCLDRLHLSAAAMPVRRWAAQARERLWCRHEPAAWRLYQVLLPRLAKTPPGGVAALPRRLLRNVAPDLLGRVAAVIAQGDFGIDLWRKWLGRRAARGDRMHFRLWRLAHDLRRPAADARQPPDRPVGRVFHGMTLAPSAILARPAPTAVPGAPLFMAEEGGWRPYLPLVDHALSAVEIGAPVRLFTSEGITEIAPPRGFLRRLQARLTLTRSFARFARLRNWTPDSGSAPTAYLRALSALGFDVRLRPHAAADGGAANAPPELDPTVVRFFPAVPPILDQALWERLWSHLSSASRITPRGLALMLSAAVLLFLGGHLYVGRRRRRTRRHVPLLLGGWDAPGESGAVRLKAALMSALGYATVAQTSGRQATLLYAPAFGRLREMLLFPGGATAAPGEPGEIAILARDLEADVLLREGVPPREGFADGGQRRWMPDGAAIVTGTGCDAAGVPTPAGRDIRDAMADLVPTCGTLVASEEQMLPILAEAAKTRSTRLVPVGWLEAGLLPDDVLRRFPDAGHPYTVALMAALAEELGLDRDFALKEMADRVLPDPGARKAYPVAQTRQAPGPQAAPLCSHAPVITAGPDRPPADIEAAAGSRAGRRMGLAARLTGWIAGWREVGHRRRVASRIYRDLVAERIGIDRAVRELQSLKDRRQHG